MVPKDESARTVDGPVSTFVGTPDMVLVPVGTITDVDVDPDGITSPSLPFPVGPVTSTTTLDSYIFIYSV